LIENLTKEVLSEHMNTKFRVHAESFDPIELELIELNVGVSTPRQEQFSIVFSGPQNPFLYQGIHHMEHDKLGEFDLFIVPIAREQDGFLYEAVFNRLPQGR
jgi:hypothetical protein